MTDANQIRADIERTRGELGSDVDALADKVTPSKIVERQTDKVKSAFGGVKDRVMGVAHDASDSAKSAASSTSGSVSDASHHAVDSAKGNPLAVGLITFGLGWLAASLTPASSKEKEVAANVKEAAQPLVAQVTDAAKEAADHLREPAADAVAAVKDSASSAAESVKSEAQGAASDVSGHAKEAQHTVQNSQY